PRSTLFPYTTLFRSVDFSALAAQIGGIRLQNLAGAADDADGFRGYALRAQFLNTRLDERRFLGECSEAADQRRLPVGQGHVALLLVLTAVQVVDLASLE